MGCCVSRTRTNNAEPEFNPDLFDLPTRVVVNRPSSKTTGYRSNSPQSLTMSGAAETLNPTTISDYGSTGNEMTTAINYIKNAYSLVRSDVSSVRSTFCNRLAPKPKTSLNSEIQGSNIIYINKPMKQVGSTSQNDFFRMLDEKIAQGSDYLIDSDTE